MSEERVRPDDGGQMANGRKGGRKLTWSVVIGVCICFVIVWVVIFNRPPVRVRRLASRIGCGSRLAAIGKAIVVYANDNNDMLPTPEKWCDLLIEHVEATPKLFVCPESDTLYGESSYAMNINLAGKKFSDVPGDTVMVFETDLGKETGRRKDLVSSRRFFKFLNLPEEKGKQKIYGSRWNQVGGSNDVTLEHHRGNGCNVLYADASVLFERSAENLKWEVNEVAVKLKVGDGALPFSLLDQDRQMVRLSDFAGKKVLVYFYPKADTPGCTKQACSVRDSTEELKKAGVVPLGISPDEPNQQRQFDEKYSLGFRLLSDTDHKVAQTYGVWGEREIAGKKSMGIIRSSFLLDEKGKLIGVWYNVRPEDTVPKAMGALK